MTLVTQLFTASAERRRLPEFSEAQLEIAYAQHWDFQIWSLIRSCALVQRRREGWTAVREGLRMAGFYDRHDAVTNGFILKSSGNLLPRTQVHPGVPSARRLWDFRTPLSLKLGSFGIDPVKYIECIPWTRAPNKSSQAKTWSNLTWLDQVKSNNQATWFVPYTLIAAETCRWRGTKLPSVI